MRANSSSPVRAFLLVLCLSVVVSTTAAELAPGPNVTPILDPDKQGGELAARLRSAAPAEQSKFKGTLTTTTRDDKVTIVPIESIIRPLTNFWFVHYRVEARPGLPGEGQARLQGEELNIIHTAGQSNTYSLDAFRPRPLLNLPPDELVRPFAGSDFWICDLGLEFLHWPQQRILKHEMRRSRSCWVLESVTPAPVPGGYARVVSWVDVEHDGILRAEAYDKAGKLMKEFTLGSLRKVDGRYQLESMKMRNVRTGSETELKFDLQKKP